VPVEAESYVHRIGRTGRAGATGQAITFCEPAERGALKDIETLVGKPVPVAAVPQDLQALSKLPEPGEEPARREHPHSGRGRQGRSAGRPQGGDGGGSGRGDRNAPKASSGKSPAHGRGGAHRKVARSGSSTAGGTSAGGTAAASARAAHPASSTPHPRAHQFPSARTPSRRGRK
jgi:ATP-dependent RNA helicase RhlE